MPKVLAVEYTRGGQGVAQHCVTHALPERAGVVAIPAQPFYDSDAGRHLVRWAFCKDPDVIERENIRNRLANVKIDRMAEQYLATLRANAIIRTP